jgi:hypothetical protein
MRCMRPPLVRPAIQAAVDGPLRRTLELLTRAETTPPEQRDAAWEQATLPPPHGRCRHRWPRPSLRRVIHFQHPRLLAAPRRHTALPHSP